MEQNSPIGKKNITSYLVIYFSSLQIRVNTYYCELKKLKKYSSVKKELYNLQYYIV